MGRSRRLSLAQPGCSFAEFSAELKSIVDDFVTEWMLLQLFRCFDYDCDGKLNESECNRLNNILFRRINRLRTALIIVDFQNDFVSGNLPIKSGSAMEDPLDALPFINQLLLRCSFPLVVYTLDWHPNDHISFRQISEYQKKTNNGNKTRDKHPIHCVQNTWGAKLHSDLYLVPDSVTVYKGVDKEVDSYSAFKDNHKRASTRLEEILRINEIDSVFVCGLAYEVCVAATAIDSNDLGFLTAIIDNCSKGYEREEINDVKQRLMHHNVPVIHSNLVRRILLGKYFPWEWICRIAGEPFRIMKICTSN